MTDRTAQILEAVIQEYISSGEPVSSGLLYERYQFGIKPAMIRLELDSLEDAGYLEQPHHSAGRIPTNAGYEFFAARVLGIKSHETRERESRERALKKIRDEQALPDFLQQLSAQLGLLSVAADRAREEVYKTGLQYLIDNLDWQDQEGIRSVIRDFEDVDRRLSLASKNMGNGPQIFIGKKSPVTESEQLSVIGGNFTIDGTEIAIFAIGPKRMDYKKVIKIFKNL